MHLKKNQTNRWMMEYDINDKNTNLILTQSICSETRLGMQMSNAAFIQFSFKYIIDVKRSFQTIGAVVA